MLRFLADENLDGRIIRGLITRRRDLDLVRAQDTALMQTPDDQVLEWAASNGRVVLSHDRNTMTDAAIVRLIAGKPMSGLVIVGQRMSVGQAIDDILILDACSEMQEWEGRLEYLPL